jgi:hypothetical protein
MELTSDNYFSPEADSLMSNSQWKHWLECPSRAHAMFVTHTFRQKTNKAMALGAMVDCLLLDPADEPRVLREHDEHFFGKAKKDGTRNELEALTSGREIAAFVKDQDWFMAIIDDAEKQVALQFDLGGIRWRVRLDMLIRSERQIWELKTTANLWKEEWVPLLGMRGTFVARWNYARQLGIQREACRQNYEGDWMPGIAGIGIDSDTPDLALMPWQQDGDGDYLYQLDDQIRIIKLAAPMIQSYREADPADLTRCEQCEHCRQTRSAAGGLVVAYHDPVKIAKGDF